jgi:hypothetical protein
VHRSSRENVYLPRRDDLIPSRADPYSITLSVRASTVTGTSRLVEQLGCRPA